MNSSKVLVLIPAYGPIDMTHDLVRDVMRESDDFKCLVVDNQGDYRQILSESVNRPNKNLGWLGACNLGMHTALSNQCNAVVLLNNDTRLSPNFFKGLQAAADAEPRSMIAPVYDDDAVASQHIDALAPDSYIPVAEDRKVTFVDGTCVWVPLDLIEKIGVFDQRLFGRHGWGAIDDYCLRAAKAGYSSVVTKRSYLSHARGASAKARNPRYEYLALAEMVVGMRLKHGRRWREKLGEDIARKAGDHEFALSLTRIAREKLGLKNLEIRKFADWS